MQWSQDSPVEPDDRRLVPLEILAQVAEHLCQRPPLLHRLW